MFNKGGQGRPRGFGFGGFSLASKKETNLPPTSAMHSNRAGSTTKHGSSSQNPGFAFHKRSL